MMMGLLFSSPFKSDDSHVPCSRGAILLCVFVLFGSAYQSSHVTVY
jgi:hypothetical protein